MKPFTGYVSEKLKISNSTKADLIFDQIKPVPEDKSYQFWKIQTALVMYRKQKRGEYDLRRIYGEDLPIFNYKESIWSKEEKCQVLYIGADTECIYIYIRLHNRFNSLKKVEFEDIRDIWKFLSSGEGFDKGVGVINYIVDQINDECKE